MATNRYISTSFWDDEWIQTLDPSEKLLYLYYMTNPLTNIAGIYKITPRRVSFDTGFNDDTIGHIMGKFEKAGKCFRFQEWIILPNWTKHQKVGVKDNNRKGIDAILHAIPYIVYEYAITHGYKYQYLEDLARPLQGSSKTFNYLNINLNPNINSNLNITDEDQEPPIGDASASTTQAIAPLPTKKKKRHKDADWYTDEINLERLEYVTGFFKTNTDFAVTKETRHYLKDIVDNFTNHDDNTFMDDDFVTAFYKYKDTKDKYWSQGKRHFVGFYKSIGMV